MGKCDVEIDGTTEAKQSKLDRRSALGWIGGTGLAALGAGCVVDGDIHEGGDPSSSVAALGANTEVRKVISAYDYCTDDTGVADEAAGLQLALDAVAAFNVLLPTNNNIPTGSAVLDLGGTSSLKHTPDTLS